MMHSVKDVVVVSNGHDLNPVMSRAAALVQSYHHFKVTIVINSNFKPEVDDPNNRAFDILYYPSNRIIEPQLLLFQLFKLIPQETLYMLTKPEQFQLADLPTCNEPCMPIMDNNSCVGLAMNHRQLQLNKQHLPAMLNHLRGSLSPSEG